MTIRFHIQAPDPGLATQIRAKLDGKTKPPGSLGRLEQVAMQIGLIQGSLSPSLARPHLLVCAGDHGALADPRGRALSAYPQAVTWQMVENFLAGGAAINVFAREAGMSLTIADAGVAHDFGNRAGLIDGFIVTAALLVAHAIAPALLPYCVFSHRSQERGHAIALEHLRALPLVDLDLRLGEGTGAALAWPLVRAAVAMLNDMASFEQAGVATRDRI